VNSSSAFSDPDGRLPAAGSVAGRPSSDRLSLSGRPGPGVVDYRSDFVQLWVLGGELTSEELAAAVADLDRAARAAESDAPAPSGPVDPNASSEEVESPAGPPLSALQFLAGLGFLRDHLWGGPALIGFLLCEGRLWALRAGIEARLDQMTGAPTRIAWHEPASPEGLAWGEAVVGEVWRLECTGPSGVLSAHARPPLASVLGTMRDEAMSDSSTPIGPELRLLPAPASASVTPEAPEAPASPAAEEMSTPASPAPPSPPAPVKAVAKAKVHARPAPAFRPRLAVPAILHSRWALVVAALLIVAALILAFTWGREPVSKALVGRYDLALTTTPAGATVRVDGELAAGRTPMTLALVPGEHRVELDYGEYANAVFTVDGSRGETVRRAFEWSGSLALSSADTTARLTVSFDGTPLGAVPLWKDDVPVGRHRLSFQGEGVRPWEEEVQVKLGQSTRVVVEPVKVPDYGLVTARAERVSRDGVEEIEGASVFVDGKAAGATPLDLRLSPGPHSVRIASGPELGPVHLIDVQPGGRFYASTTFGRPAEPAVAFELPPTVSRARPPVLAVVLAADVPLPVRRMRLFVKAPGATRFTDTDLAVAAREDGRPRGTIPFPVAGFASGAVVRYYVGIETREGEEYFSEVKTATIVP
jgi:hypothetical protein